MSDVPHRCVDDANLSPEAGCLEADRSRRHCCCVGRSPSPRSSPHPNDWHMHGEPEAIELSEMLKGVPKSSMAVALASLKEVLEQIPERPVTVVASQKT